MSADNQNIGRNIYRRGRDEDRAWMELQWRVWPERADDRKTMNIALHYGGVTAFRQVHGRDPAMSDDFAIHVRFLDGCPDEPQP